MNTFLQRNWITFIIYCDQIIPKLIFKQLELSLRWLIFLLLMVSFCGSPNLLIILHIYFMLQVVYNGKELNHPFGISHYRNFIFWTEYMNASVFQLDLSTGDVTLLRSERPPLFGLRVYDAQSQQGWLFSLYLLLVQCHRTMDSLTEKVAFLHWKYDHKIWPQWFVLYICTAEIYMYAKWCQISWCKAVHWWAATVTLKSLGAPL